MFKKITILALITGLILTFGMSKALADQSSGVGPQTVRLNFAVNIPTVLFLRVGSPGVGVIDTVTFNVTDFPPPEGTQATVAGTPGDIILRVGAMTPATQNLFLLANSSVDMMSGSDHLPFTTITYTLGGADFSGSAAFDSTTNQQLWTSTGPGFRDGTMNFTYDNSTPYATGNYTGYVDFTLSAP